MARKKREKVKLTGDEEQLVSFRLGKEIFGVKVAQVREIGKVQDITRIPQMPAFIEGVLNLRGQITTVIDLKKRLNIVIEGDKGITSASRIIIAEIGDTQIGIIVDSVEDVIRVPRVSISPAPNMISTGADNYLTGICKLPDRLVMLLDLNKLMGQTEMEQVANLAVPPKAAVLV